MSRTTKLKRVASLAAGGTPTVDEPAFWDESDGIPWVSIGDMSDGLPVYTTSRRVSVAGLTAKRLPVGKPGTLLFAMYASVGAVGQLAVEATWNQALLGIEPREMLADRRFIRYWLEHLRPTLSAMSRSNTQDNLNAEQVGNFPFPTIEVAEQRAIADYLDTETARIDALIAKKRRMIELLEERRARYVFDGITGELTSPLVPKKETPIAWLGPIPDHWGTPWLGANHSTQLGKMLNSDAASGSEQRRYLKNTNVKWDSFELGDLPSMSFDAADRARCDLRRGDLLVCEGGEVGRSAVWPGEPEDVYFQKALHRVRPLRHSDSEQRFLMYCLWAAASLNVFAVEGNQATIVHLTGEKLREHRFPWPPVSEQREIVRLVDQFRERTERASRLLAEQINLLVEHRQALITEAVTGELDVSKAA